MPGWGIVGLSVAYLIFLFLAASHGDRRWALYGPGKSQALIYSLTLAIYCTSWTFFGSVGLAATSGYEYLAIYIGPLLVFTLGAPLVRRMIRLTKSERITSVADFLAARYGKSFAVAALATVIATVGAIPYIALQLKALAGAVELMVTHYDFTSLRSDSFTDDYALLVAVILAVFAALFGTRHADVTEHQAGMMFAIAIESIVKLAAFLAVGLLITFMLFGSPSGLVDAVAGNEQVSQALAHRTPIHTWIALTFMSAVAILALPRQFHVAFVENHDERHLNTALWVFPLYLVLINIFVIPIAMAGAHLVGGTVKPDLYILAVPLASGHEFLAAMVFIGGLSAATAMVIVASVALSIMVSNDLVFPLFIRRMHQTRGALVEDPYRLILVMRRITIAIVLLAAYAYYRNAKDEIPLFSIGLLSFAAISQFAPALIGGLYWRRANSRGALLGMGAGFVTWFVVLLLPSINGVYEGSLAMLDGGAAQESLRSFAGQTISTGLFLSIAINTVFFILGSLTYDPGPLEKLQSTIFVPQGIRPSGGRRRGKADITAGMLKDIVSRYLGRERTERAFRLYEQEESVAIDYSLPADPPLMGFAEQQLASAIGSSSARLVFSLVLQRSESLPREAFRLLDDASEALQQNRDLLQIALDQMEQGIMVLDRDFRLTCWNRQFRLLLGLPESFGRVGVSLGGIMKYLIERGEIAESKESETVLRLNEFGKPWRIQLANAGKTIEIRSNPMPDGGIVTTFADITQAVQADIALKRANESLEQRVADRTDELLRVNTELAKARAAADAANLSKTRFLAASGHDILQPLNAARLYCSSLIEKASQTNLAPLAGNIDSSLESVETILGAVLDISRLDSGGMQPSITRFAVQDVLNQIRTDLQPLADGKRLLLKVVPTSVWIESDRNLFRRMVQNLISNALKYTRTGEVLVGVKKRGDDAELLVIDTGIGIPESKIEAVFGEFTRLEEGIRESDGLGLGLSIVDRISRVLGHDLSIRSTPGRGTTFGALLHPKEPIRDASTNDTTGGSAARRIVANAHVLCIDNKKEILDGMQTLLGGWGCTVSGFDGLKSATDHARKGGRHPDVILADYHLDDGTGLEAIEALRDIWRGEIPAYLLTADRSAEVRALARELDVLVINKPIKPAVIRSIIAQAATRHEPAE